MSNVRTNNFSCIIFELFIKNTPSLCLIAVVFYRMPLFRNFYQVSKTRYLQKVKTKSKFLQYILSFWSHNKIKSIERRGFHLLLTSVDLVFLELLYIRWKNISWCLIYRSSYIRRNVFCSNCMHDAWTLDSQKNCEKNQFKDVKRRTMEFWKDSSDSATKYEQKSR